MYDLLGRREGSEKGRKGSSREGKGERRLIKREKGREMHGAQKEN